MYIIKSCAVIVAFIFSLSFASAQTSPSISEVPVMCTMEYAPVCGELNVPVMNGSSIPTQTFSNMCMLNAKKAKFLYEGECKVEKPQACTREYAPVCGKTPAKVCMGPGCASEEKTYGNKCMLEADSATYLYTGECTKTETKLPEASKTKYYMGDTNSCMMIKFACETGWEYFSDTLGCGCEKKVGVSGELSLSTKNRLHTLIEQFIKKLEAKNYSDEKNISLIDTVLSKLSALQLQEKYTAIAKYTRELLEIQKQKYSDDLSIIEEILK